MREDLLLEVKSLTTVFGSGANASPAVRDLNFSLSRGETMGLVGESGSGKSVTSLSIMHLLPPNTARIQQGQIVFHHQDQTLDLTRSTEQDLRALRGNRLAMIFQEPMTSLNPVMRCGEQVVEALKLHKGLNNEEAKTRTLTLFNEVKLPEPESMFLRYPHQLSGGQKQRVMIAMAMSCEPDLLIADEPTTALDVTVQKTILELMKELQAKHGLGIIFITHDLGVVSELAHKVAVMYKGQIVEQGSVREVFENPQHPYTKSLLACRPTLDQRLKRLPVVSDFVELSADGTFVARNHKVASEIITLDDRQKRLQTLYAGKKMLEVKNLCTWYPAKQTVFGKALSYTKAVDDVSFDVFEGETLGLVGESGCGKSTLGRTLIRLAKATSGQVFFDGKDLLGMGEKEFRPFRRQMQIIFQDPYSSLNPRMPIGEAIMEPMRVHGLVTSAVERRKRALALMERVGLVSAQFNRFPHEFSGGQRQRVVIARALAVNPRFVICDESVSALDVSVQAQVLNLINELKEELRFTTIFISHDLGVVKYMSDRMLVMQKGQIVERGDPDEIYRNPKDPYTQRLIASIPGTGNKPNRA